MVPLTVPTRDGTIIGVSTWTLPERRRAIWMLEEPPSHCQMTYCNKPDVGQPKQAALVLQLKVHQSRAVVVSGTKNQLAGRNCQLRATNRGSQEGAAKDKPLHTVSKL